MTSSTAFLVLGFLAVAAAAPWPSNPPRCSTECPIAGSPKLAYASEKTYLYSYTGKSQIYLKDVEGGKADMEWSSQVELSWLTPCDVAISLKSPSIAGASGSPEARFLERYPLVVAMIDGRVQQTCQHPDDDVWSINLKKGIASAFQNSLPSNSSINSGLNITETDIIGNCSTMYEVDNQGEKVLVKKMKNHRFCQDLYVNRAETPKAWPKAPLPLEESVSECKQEVTKGIYTSIICKDTKIIRPIQGSYKHVEAYQEAVLRFQSETDEVPPSISNLRGHLIRKSLRYDQQTLKKDASMVAKLDETLKQVCANIEGGVKEEAATHVAKALRFLRRVPEQVIPETLQKIRSGQYCGSHQKLEGLFLDTLAFIHESGAVKVMVEELLSGKATGGRAALYTAALYMMPRPCIHSVEAVKPLIESYQRFPRVVMAAASMVNTYCKQIPNCEQQAPVRQIAESLSGKVNEKCSAPGDEHAREEALVILKALANMGVMTVEIARPVIQCIEKEEADNSIRMAATQTFRNIQCDPEIKPAMKQLVNIVVDPRKGTEARIGSYLAAMKCPNSENLHKIIRKLSHEENTQVRDFILSHLHNVQESGAPYKEDLKYLLSTIVLPSNYTSDWRTTSRNIDLSYYAPTFGAGAGMESNVIFVPGSFIPRSVSFNLTAALGATPINIGEIGARIEGLEPIMEHVFGPEGYMKTKTTSEVFQHIWSSMEDKISTVKDRIQGAFRQKRSIDFSTVSRLFEKLYGDKRSRFPKADLFARINDQEIAFASLAGDLKNINVDQLINRFFDSIEEMISNAAHADLDVVRGAQIFLDYHVPTMAGMPIKIELEGTAVAGIKMETRLNGLSGGSPNVIKFIPTMSTQVDGFIGFDSHIVKAGVKMSSKVSSATGASINIKTTGSNGFELEVEIPEKMELINLNSETYLMKLIKGQEETRIQPPSVRSTRVQKQSCTRALEKVIGIKICYDVNIPNIFLSEGLPLGPPTIGKLFIEKSDSSMKGYLMKGHVQNAGGKKEIKVEVGTPGSSTPRKTNVALAYSGEGGMDKVSCVLESHNLGGVKMEFRKKWTDSEKLIELDAYGSRSQQYSPEAKAIEAKLQMNFIDAHEIKVDSHIRTLNAMKAYADINIEANGDFRYTEETKLPLPRRLRKFEFNVGSSRWHLLSFIRKESDTKYTSALRIGARSEETVIVEASHGIEGSIEAGFTMNNDLKAKFGSTQYKTLTVINFTGASKGITVNVVRQGDSSKIIEAEALLVSSGSESYKLNFLLDVPAYVNAIKFDVSAAHQGSSQYQIVVDAKHGGNPIFHVEGPVTAKMSSKMTQLQTQLQMTCLRSEPHTMAMTILFAPTKQAIVFGLLRHSERLIDIEWIMATQDAQETKVDFKLVIPSLIEKSVNAIISRKLLHVSVNQLVSPKNSPQRMKGFFDIDFESKKAQAEFAWDADRTPNKKVKAEVALIGSSTTLRNLSIQGGWTYIESHYQFKSELSLSDPQTWFSGRNTMKLDFTTPSQRTYECESVVNIDNQPSTLKVDTTNSIKTPERQEYRVKSESSLEWLEGPNNMKVTTKLHFTSPQGQQSEAIIEAKHQWSSGQREAYVQVHVTSPSLHEPLQTKLELMNRPSQYSIKWMIEGSSPAVGAMYELRLSPEGGVQAFKTEANLEAISQLLKSVEQMVSPSGTSVSGSHQLTQGVYLIDYRRPTPTSHSLLYKTPSRTMEGEAKFSLSETHIRFQPHKGVSDAKYAFYMKHSHSEWDKTSKIDGRISHPSLDRDMQVNVQYGSNGQKISGSIEIDIFSNPEDKISGKLESLIYARNTVAIDAHLTGKVLKVNPKVNVYAAYGRDTAGFDIKFHKTPSAPISFLMSGKFDRSSGRNAAVSFIVETEGQIALDIALSSRRQQTPTCYGIKVEAKAKSSVIGSYDVWMNLCEPLRIEMASRKHDSETMYITKAGMRGMKDAEVSVSEENFRTGETRVHGMIRAYLTSSSMVTFETKYEREEMNRIGEDVEQKWFRIVSAAGTWLDNMSREVLKEGGSPSSKVSMMWQEIKAEASRIYEDIKEDLNIPQIERIKQWMESDIVRGLATSYSKLWSQYSQVKQQMASLVSVALRTIDSEFEGIRQRISEAVVGSASWLETGDVPEVVRRMWNEIQEYSVYRRFQSEIDSIGSQYPAEYQGLRQIVEKVKVTLVKEIEEQRRSIMHLRKPQQLANWIKTQMNFEQMVFRTFNRMVKAVVQNALFLNVQSDGHHVQLEIPTYRPVRSLPQAASYASLSPVPSINVGYWGLEAFLPTPVDNLIWTYYKFLPRHARYLVPPFNRTAVIVDGTEILTFDGAVLRAPHSPCKVVLAEHKYGSLVMQNQQPNTLPHFVMKESGVTVEVKPDFTVLVNGRPVSGPQQTEGKVRVHMESEKVEVMAPIMTLRVYKASRTATVEASGWAFGQLAGLFGTFDGEISNDKVTPTGSRPSTLKELVKSWQEDQGCATPNVSPVSPLQTPVVHMFHCNAFFGLQSRCNPILGPEPFIRMCYNSKDACHVARAYSALCATKGVKDVFPLGC